MENASKALIIAGAILLSILLIGLGMFVYQQAAGTVQNANLNAEQVSAFNSKFEHYEGTQPGTQVRALIRTINTNNAVEGNSDIEITGTTTAAAVVPGQTYTVTFTYGATGLITGCAIADTATP